MILFASASRWRELGFVEHFVQFGVFPSVEHAVRKPVRVEVPLAP
jgi:hypothetical protein